MAGSGKCRWELVEVDEFYDPDAAHDELWRTGCGEDIKTKSNGIALFEYCPLCGKRLWVRKEEI